MLVVRMIAMGQRRSPTSRLPGATVAAFLLALTVRVPEAPATVAEQRARLPPAAECEHPVEGTWKAVVYSENHLSWYEFVLEVRRVKGSVSALTGMIYVDTWGGGPEQSEPGPCAGYRRIKGKMEGRGSFADGQVVFGGREFQLVEDICGERQAVPYDPDQFTGRIEPERQEFQSVNNDGGSAVNEPTVFRRIACFDHGPVENAGADVKPPPFFPARREGGC
jgi:hypothetical protein